MKNKFINRLLPFLMAVLLPISSLAATIDTGTIDEKWGKPSFVYGETLNNQQIDETADLLKIKDMENVNAMSVSHSDLVKYLGEGDGGSSNMISSVLVKKEDKGSGVDVSIETPNNITKISKEQYENAAITAGVNDCSIMVAAIRPVTGESALSGVYKAFEANGEELDQERMQAAQDELNTVSDVAEDNKDKEGFEEKNLDKLVVEVKQKLSDATPDKDQPATKEDVERIVNDALEKYDLKGVISETNVNQLVQYFINYSRTDAVNSDEVKEQLNQLGNKLGQAFDSAVQTAKEEGWWDNVVSFFKDLFDQIGQAFSS